MKSILLTAAAAILALAGGDPQPHAAPPAQRIITIAPNSAEIICALDACDRIVGVDKFCTYPPSLADRPRVGGLFDPDLEKIVSLRPDLIVLRGHSESVEKLCRDLKINLYLDPTEKLADIKTCITDLARLTGKEARGRQLVDDFQARLAAIRASVAGKPRPRVLLTVSRRPDRIASVTTAAKGTFLDDMIEVAGGVNVFGHLEMAYPQVSAEGILTARPEVILELMPELNANDKLREELRAQWAAVGPIPAVKTGRIHFLTDANVLIPSPRYAEIIEKATRLLHGQPTSSSAPP